MKTTALRKWYHHIPAGSQHAAGGFVSTSEDRKDIDAQVICHVHFDIKHGKLISAAPELLEAATFARDLAMRMTAKPDIPYCAEFAAIAQELDAAIAKAIGHEGTTTSRMIK